MGTEPEELRNILKSDDLNAMRYFLFRFFVRRDANNPEVAWHQFIETANVVDRQFHPHQKDQLPAWTEGRLLNWWFAPQQVEAHAVKRQALVPK